MRDRSSKRRVAAPMQAIVGNPTLTRSTPAQRAYFKRLIEVMEEDELLELVLHAFELAEPNARAELLNSAAEITNMRPFLDGRHMR